MKIFGKPEYLNEYRKHYEPLLAGINTDKAFPTLEIHFRSSGEMPKGMQGTRVKFTPPKSVYVPMANLPDVEKDTYMQSLVLLIAHEFGHYIHETFMGEDGSEKWQEWADLIGNILEFEWAKKYAATPYPVIPSYEDFAWDFAYWLRGKRLEMEAFYMGLWGQQAKVTAKDIEIFRGILGDTGEEGARKLKEELERDNPRALLYL